MQFRKLLFDTATVVTSIFCLFPVFTGNKSFRLLVIAACSYIVFVSFKKIVIAKKIPILKIVFAFIISFIISYIVGIKYSINFYIHFTILIVFILIFEYYRLRGLESMKNVVFIILGFLFVSNLQTIIMLNSNASYARTLTKNQDLVEIAGLAGGYGLIYASLLAFLSIIFLGVKRKMVSLIFRVNIAVTSISCIILIWKAGFFLALILLVIGVVAMFGGVNKNKMGKSLGLALLIFGFFFVLRSSISEMVINNSIGTKYEKKVRQIFEENNGISSTSNEFEERESRYLRDFDVMLEYPIVGSWQFLTVGKHSFILDTLAQYGFIFGASFIYTVFFIPLRIVKISEGLAFNQAFVVVGTLFLFLTLNSFAITLIPIVFVIFPFANYQLRLK